MLMRYGIAALLAAASLPAVAGDINNIGGLNQGQFHDFSQDLGSALSYKPLTPTEPLGLFGFDLGIAATDTKVKNTSLFQIVGAGNDVSTIVVPQLRANVGLPFSFDVGAMYAEASGTNARLAGGELRWSFVPGSTVMPAIGVRGAFTKLAGVDQLDLTTKSVDLSISKGFAFITPYGGIGKVWTTSTPKNIPASAPNPNLSQESISQNKYFVGVQFKILLFNLVVEADKTGDDTTYGAKVGVRF
jgi:hypothetical protein